MVDGRSKTEPRGSHNGYSNGEKGAETPGIAEFRVLDQYTEPHSKKPKVSPAKARRPTPHLMSANSTWRKHEDIDDDDNDNDDNDDDVLLTSEPDHLRIGKRSIIATARRNETRASHLAADPADEQFFSSNGDRHVHPQRGPEVSRRKRPNRDSIDELSQDVETPEMEREMEREVKPRNARADTGLSRRGDIHRTNFGRQTRNFKDEISVAVLDGGLCVKSAVREPSFIYEHNDADSVRVMTAKPGSRIVRLVDEGNKMSEELDWCKINLDKVQKLFWNGDSPFVKVSQSITNASGNRAQEGATMVLEFSSPEDTRKLVEWAKLILKSTELHGEENWYVVQIVEFADQNSLTCLQ